MSRHAPTVGNEQILANEFNQHRNKYELIFCKS